MRATAAGVVVFALALARSVTDGFGLVDESWFLQVIARLRHGDVLYRDVFLGTTPLSAYVTLAVSHLVGIEILAVKIVTNACFAVTAVLAMCLARRAGASSLGAMAVLAATFVWGRPYGNPPYTPMAMALLLAAALAASAPKTPGVFLSGQKDAGGLWRWLVAGGLAGLSFAAKQNVGLLALAAVGLAWVAGGRPASRAGASAVLVGFAGAAGFVLVPVAWSGGLPALWDYGFAGKGGYLTLGGVSFAESLRGWLAALAAPISGPNLGTALHGVVLILPLAVLALAAVRARSLDTRTGIIVLFAVLATLTALPRWDRFHMAHAVPLHAVALAALASRARAISTTPARRRTGRAATVASVATIAMGLVVALHPAGALLGEGREPSRLTHFRGPLIAPATAADLEEAAGRIAREAAGQPVFILSLEAGFWHLASGVPNATPFDIPATTSLGATGVTWLADRLADGRIRQVCVDRRRQDRLVLVDLAALVDATFDRGADVGPCTWYRFRERR